MEEGTRNELAALTRLRQEDNLLKSAKMLREEIEETLHPMEVMDMEERQDFKRAVNITVDLIRAQSGGPSEHRSPSFVRWMMAKTMDRCETGQALSEKLIQECLRQPGNRTSVWLILRSRWRTTREENRLAVVPRISRYKQASIPWQIQSTSLSCP
jgi:hypothetical protein